MTRETLDIVISPRRRRLPRILGLSTVGLALVGTVAAVVIQASRPSVLFCGDYVLRAEPPIRTGHQRAERLCFADNGRLLAVTCPRYNQVVLYRMSSEQVPNLVADIATGGRPVAIQAAHDRLYVLQRPTGDARHLEPAWWQAFDFEGSPLGSKFRLGWDPDDMVLTDDGRTMFVILSGNAEGESNRPAPSLLVVDLTTPGSPRVRGSLSFDHPGDDPERIAFLASQSVERSAATTVDLAGVSLRGSNEIAWIDCSNLDQPRLTAHTPLPDSGEPGPLGFGRCGHLLATNVHNGTVWELAVPDGMAGEPRGIAPSELRSVTPSLARPEASEPPRPSCIAGDTTAPDLPSRLAFGPGIVEVVQVHESTDHDGTAASFTIGTAAGTSRLEVLDANGRNLGRLPLAGPFGFGNVIPTGLAATRTPDGATLAVADRSGGVHIVRWGRGTATVSR